MSQEQTERTDDWNWDPFSEMVNLQREMNNLFVSPYSGNPTADTTLLRGQWAPPIDVYDSKDNLMVRVDLPGIDKNNVDISIQENTLTVKGEKKPSSDVKEENCYRSERSLGKFNRVLSLPTEVDTSKANANFNDGVLELVLPKKEEVKPKQIKIDVN
jgi:HSP20 family protein